MVHFSWSSHIQIEAFKSYPMLFITKNSVSLSCAIEITEVNSFMFIFKAHFLYNLCGISSCIVILHSSLEYLVLIGYFSSTHNASCMKFKSEICSTVLLTPTDWRLQSKIGVFGVCMGIFCYVSWALLSLCDGVNQPLAGSLGLCV